MSNLEAEVEFVTLLLAGALAVGLIAQRIRIPYIVALLLASLPFHNPRAGTFGTQVLFIFLPALIFEAAWNLDLPALARTWRPIALLALPGVVFTALLIGYGLSWSEQLPLREGILLGSIIAATDPIAVIATFRRLHVPHDLATIVEGESLFNDGAARCALFHDSPFVWNARAFHARKYGAALHNHKPWRSSAWFSRSHPDRIAATQSRRHAASRRERRRSVWNLSHCRTSPRFRHLRRPRRGNRFASVREFSRWRTGI